MVENHWTQSLFLVFVVLRIIFVDLKNREKRKTNTYGFLSFCYQLELKQWKWKHVQSITLNY